MTLDIKLIKEISKVTSKSAIASFKHIGKDNKILADKSATDSMRTNLNNINFSGEVVIGEGELDKAPMLYIGEKLGKSLNPKIDIAVDPLEGTNFVAKNLPGAISVIVISESGNLFKAPETYMNKIAVGKNIPKDAIDLDYSIEKNIKNLADCKNKKLTELTACLLNRPRHKSIINKLNELQVNLKLIEDGDVTGSLLVSDDKYNVDIFLGIGGGPEGVICAAALDAYKCKFQGRFLFTTANDISRAKKMGIKDLNKKYELNEIIKGDSIFCATGVTDNELVNGVKVENNKYITETLVTHKNSTIEIVKMTEPTT